MGRKEIEFAVEKRRDQRKEVVKKEDKNDTDEKTEVVKKTKETKDLKNLTWGQWLKTPEGAEKMKNFVILQSVCTMGLAGLPYLIPHLQDLYAIISKFFRF